MHGWFFAKSQYLRRQRRPELCGAHCVFDGQAGFEPAATQRVVDFLVGGRKCPGFDHRDHIFVAINKAKLVEDVLVDFEILKVEIMFGHRACLVREVLVHEG